MLNFIAELLGELVLGTILNWVLALAYVLLRTATWLVLHPFLLLLGWGWLRWRGRSSVGWLLVWQGRGPQALYRVGRWQARQAGHLLLAALLLVLAAVGVAAVLYGLAQHVGL